MKIAVSGLELVITDPGSRRDNVIDQFLRTCL
jgi:hypothetical protein